jgi:hypothetical protein
MEGARVLEGREERRMVVKMLEEVASVGSQIGRFVGVRKSRLMKQ